MKRILGALLVALSVASVLQTLREIRLHAESNFYSEEWIRPRTVTFGGHTFSIIDNQPPGSPGETQYEGIIQLVADGKPTGPPSRARVRRGRDDFGRYHGWVDAVIFRRSNTGQRTLFIARRIQPTPSENRHFLVTTVESDGKMNTRDVPWWQLSGDYRLERATEFLSQESITFPLAVGEALVVFPILVAVFPVGTAILGALLLLASKSPRRP